MSEPASPIRFSEPADAEIAKYRAVSRLAVTGLVFGLLSPLALLEVSFWAVPALAIVLSGVAVWQTGRPSSVLVGRKAALIGLALGVMFGAAAPADWIIYRRQLRIEARQFADLWFHYLQQGQVHKAHHLTIPPTRRWLLDEALWEYYRAEHRPQELKIYAAQPPIRAILALGDKAEIRYYQTLAQPHSGGRDFVRLAYAVTYEEEGTRKTFFVAVVLEHVPLEAGRANWTMLGIEGGIRPPGW